MASLGIEAIAAWAPTALPPMATDGKDFFDTGVALVTDKPVDGVDSDRHGRRARLSAGADPPLQDTSARRRASARPPRSAQARASLAYHFQGARGSWECHRRTITKPPLGRRCASCCNSTDRAPRAARHHSARPARNTGAGAADRSDRGDHHLRHAARAEILLALCADADPAAGADRRRRGGRPEPGHPDCGHRPFASARSRFCPRSSWASSLFATASRQRFRGLCGLALSGTRSARSTAGSSRVKLPPFIVTLGMWQIVLAANYLYSRQRDDPQPGHRGRGARAAASWALKFQCRRRDFTSA
jgi:hypothetical protein